MLVRRQFAFMGGEGVVRIWTSHLLKWIWWNHAKYEEVRIDTWFLLLLVSTDEFHATWKLTVMQQFALMIGWDRRSGPGFEPDISNAIMTNLVRLWGKGNFAINNWCKCPNVNSIRPEAYRQDNYLVRSGLGIKQGTPWNQVCTYDKGKRTNGYCWVSTDDFYAAWNILIRTIGLIHTFTWGVEGCGVNWDWNQDYNWNEIRLR